MKKIFISGAAGFIGSHLAEFLHDKYFNYKFILYDKVTYAGNKKFLSCIIR